jgi:hypothetical protein
MLNRKTCTTLALILVLAASPVLAAETDSDPHHPASATVVPNSPLMPGCVMSETEGGMPMMRMMVGQDGMHI